MDAVTENATQTAADKDRSDPLRVDAARNRARVAAAAREAFAELGADAPMVEIARRAGVGAATLYRRFPTREDLLELVFEDRIEECAATIDRFLAQAATDPWGAFSGYLRQLFDLQRADRAFTAALLHSYPETGRMEQERQRAMAGFSQLVARAKSAGVVRDDFAAEDVELLLKAHEGVLTQPGPDTEASSRITDLLLDACQPRPAR
ncbi:TetR/AcrR family transcriptional regulator [Kribbella sp. NPDC005582]|uniref:TetR/AcrR family transcriptional regulator n=1 Tax=Kribbella sp. NPDC005582 TaxID=3156893 RepID=UPI0033AD82EB